jgi:gliding motility-associated-like protein
LSWTSYLGWSDHIEQYEIWYGKDDESQMMMVASFKPDQYTWSNNWGADAFDHRYRVRALHSTFPFESWSNELMLSFNHAVEIPNVFTPNGDGINDTFSFANIELFHENELQVFDRYGKEVFARTNYSGDWSGGNLSAGVYYYSFTEMRNHLTYKGWLQILK